MYVQLPQNRKPIGSKWVYKVKYKSDGMIERHKARLVAKYFSQIEGIDYNETFAPGTKLVTVKAMIAIALTKKRQLHQVDVHNAFLQGDLEEEIYMKPPEGMLRSNNTRVCKLRKSIYGLKHASRNWFTKLRTRLVEMRFIQSSVDYSLFTHTVGNKITHLLVCG